MAIASVDTTAPGLSTVRRIERAVFKYGNKYFMLPILQHGMARFMSSPPTGYFLVLQTTGRKSGQVRYTPLNYAIGEGCVYCLAGFGEGTNWLANLRSDPHVQVKLPGRVIDGIAEEVADRVEARTLAVRVARSCGMALFFESPRCMFMNDAELEEVLDGRPVVRIRPVGGPIVPGPYDPGGWGWVPLMLAQVAAIAALLALLRRRRSRRKGRA